VPMAIMFANLDHSVSGQEKTPAKKAAKSKTATKESKKKEFRGRLPAYYARVVEKEQRKAIYAIQKEYNPRIKALKAELAALTKERDGKIAELLTPEQLKEVAQLKAAAKAKRLQNKAAKEKTAVKGSAETPTEEADK